MKCSKCHKHFKHVRNLDHVDSICPDCFNLSEIQTGKVYDNTVQLRKLFEEIIVHHVATAELRDVYRRHWDDIVSKNVQNKA